MHFTREYIDELLSRIKLIDIMKENGVQVRDGVGKNGYYIADWCCGKTDYDNGRIDKIKNTFKCMACGQQGNAIHFLNEYKKKNFREAVIYLAEKAKMELPQTNSVESKKQRRKYKAMQHAVDFYKEHSHSYLLSRGISKEVIKSANIGYAPGGRLLRDYLEEKGFEKEELKEFGLVNSMGMDFMFYRAIIPYVINGKVVSLYGRAVNDEKAKRKHVYINGEFVLGGFDQINPEQIVCLFESGIDRLVAESFGIKNGIDTGGAGKFQKAHARLLKQKGVDQVCIIFDGDDAGRKGSYDTGQILAEEGIGVWVVELPDNQDPASLLMAEGIKGIQPYTEKYKEFEEYRVFYELDQLPLDLIKKYLNEKNQVNMGAGVVS